MAGLADEQRTDEEIADGELGDDDLLVLDRDTWRAVAPVQHELLTATVRCGVAGAIAWLECGEWPYVVTPAGRRSLG